MLTPLLLLVPVSIGVTWLVAQGIANAPFDRALEYNVRALAKVVDITPGREPFVLPPAAHEILRAHDADHIYFQLQNGDGQLLAGDRDVPQPNTEDVPTPGVVYLHTGDLHGQPVRVASLWIAGPTPESPPALLQLAETREKQSVLAGEIIKGVLLPQFAILPLAVLLIWLALVRGIKPLSVIEARIR